MRSALERAVEVARRGEEATPVVPAPKELQPYLRFRQLAGAALGAVLRVLDTDIEFRQRVLDATTPGEVDAAGWLALTRPSGWADLLGDVARGRDDAHSSEQAERRLRDLQRKLEAADGRREHALAELAHLREEFEAATEELAVVRRAKRKVEEERSAAARRVAELEEKVGDREARLVEAQGAREAREHELDETRRQVAALGAEVQRRPAPLVPGERPVDVHRLREAASRLQRAASSLGRSVDAVLAEVPSEPVVVLGAEPVSPLERRPHPLPGGVVADTAEGARWLLGRTAVVLLVDGYNVAKAAWPDAELAQERTRLIRALDELAARTGATVEIVFDGPEDAVPAARQGTRSVGVRYSGGALADDVIIEMIGGYPLEHPVVVVSSDREVRDGARAEGAQVIGADTLIGLFGG